MTRVFHAKHHSATRNGRRGGDTWPREAQSLLLLRGRSLLAGAALALPVARPGHGDISQEGGFVLAANHTSNFDPWPLGLPLWPESYLRFMAKAELYWLPLSRLDRCRRRLPGATRRARRRGDQHGRRARPRGQVVAMFPEGTRQQKGLVKKYEARAHTGAARIALEAGVPLVPAAIAGTDRLTARAAARALRGADRARRSEGQGPFPRSTRGDRAADGGDRRGSSATL